MSMVADQFADKVNMTNFAAWLKDEYGLRGGARNNTLQGGGGKFDPQLENAIKDWLQK